MEELEKYQILFSEIDELVYFCDTKGNILSVNPAFEKLTGHEPEEFLGKPFAYLFDAENLKKAINAYTRTLKGESLKYELYFKDTGILCEYKNIPLRDKKGNITGVIGFARDISEHKRMHEGGFLVISTDVVEMDRTFIKAHGFGEIGKYVLMSISDTGIGMDEDTKLRIFEPFFTTKEVGKGTGLGLSIVYGIAKEHNGYINVDSAPGKGTTFRIYLPLIESTIEHTKAEFHTITPECSICTILLAEDASEVRNLIKIVLEVSGCKVIEAVDGEDAIKKMRPDIKVLFISGYGDDIIAKTNIYKDGLTYILKPVSPTEILEKVKYVMNN
ncbi:MAG: ATP-binding protein [Planctomycetota bacterium]